MLTIPAEPTSPWRTFCEPWRISMRSIEPRLICERLGAFMSGLLRRSPSTMTRSRPNPFSPYPRGASWVSAGLFAPRCAKSSVADFFCRRSARSLAPLAAISARETTCTAAGISAGVFPVREASTTTRGSSAAADSVSFVSACAASAAAAATAAGISFFIFSSFPLLRGYLRLWTGPHSGFHGCATAPGFHRPFRTPSVGLRCIIP